MIIPMNNKNKSLYEQIYEYLRDEIRFGKIIDGEKLPSKRSLAAQNFVSVNTVDAAYSQLVAEGYVESRPKRGFFVCQIEEYLMNSPIDEQGVLNKIKEELKDFVSIDFSPNSIDGALFPYNAFRKIFKGVFNEYDSSLLNKPKLQGDLLLRKTLRKLLHRSRGVNCSEDQIIIGAGTDMLLQILSFLWGKNKIIAFENPVYLKAYKTFERMGSEVIPIDIDEKGIQIEPLQDLENTAIYVTPSHQFPLGMSMPIDRRIRLLNFANQSKEAYIIEDDYDSEFRYHEKPLPSLQSIDKNGKVIYIGTFSKSIAPSIRISYMVLPELLLKKYSAIKRDITVSVSSLEQKMIAAFIEGGDFEKHVNKMRKVYKEKRRFLMEELKALEAFIAVTGENAGHHLLIQLKTGMSEESMVKTALAVGVKVYPISPYFINGIVKKYESSVLIGYVSLSYDEIKKGVDLLKKAWEIM